MSPKPKSIFAFGIYLLLLGGLFLLVPNLGLPLLGLPITNEPWIHVGGISGVGLSYYYIRAALSETTVFFHWTLQARPAAALGFAALVVFKLADPCFGITGN
ncbi:MULTISPECIES: hypothetical protein [unclassified Coleofasciculus]|uniref:hypothetical protein n=1 Tax=unclassified Coleofasciculus TaxID=2692782 RepID=UPI0018800F62|nr:MULTISPECIES: hypothetical protein [unclassified Coleofasciculus]MBE9128544.1 hypothetical protein [Coleofasciculus sp. LEGE 07081]MBE9151709.1 hypothetical protein [Coleofasciculus sp. LEGE 07092]